MANKRIPAAETCLKNGWKIGTILMSKEWRMKKRISGVVTKGDQEVRLFHVRDDGSAFQEEYPRSFPSDVEEVRVLEHA